MSSDLSFITNEQINLKDRLQVLIHPQTQFFDVLVGYFYLSGFHLLYPALEQTEKIRILIGLKTDQRTFDLLDEAKTQSSFQFISHAEIKHEIEPNLIDEFKTTVAENESVENGISKFLEWCRAGKLEIKVYPSRKIHAKLYIMTFVETDRDKGRVITGSSNLSQSGLQGNLEFNVELKNRAVTAKVTNDTYASFSMTAPALPRAIRLMRVNPLIFSTTFSNHYFIKPWQKGVRVTSLTASMPKSLFSMVGYSSRNIRINWFISNCRMNSFPTAIKSATKKMPKEF